MGSGATISRPRWRPRGRERHPLRCTFSCCRPVPLLSFARPCRYEFGQSSARSAEVGSTCVVDATMANAIARSRAETQHGGDRNELPRRGIWKRKGACYGALQRRRRTVLALATTRVVLISAAAKNVIDQPMGERSDLWSKCFLLRLVVAVVAEWDRLDSYASGRRTDE